MTDDQELKTLTSIDSDMMHEPNDASVMIEEARSAHDNERVYVVRVHASASREVVSGMVGHALQRRPGLGRDYEVNEESENRIGHACPTCECGGVISSVSMPVPT